jgi:hypothetical protein
VSYGSHSGAITEEQAKTAAAGKAIGFAVGQVGDYVEAVCGFSNAAGEIFDFVRKGVFDNGQVQTYGFEEIPTVQALMENRKTKGVISIQV